MLSAPHLPLHGKKNNYNNKKILSFQQNLLPDTCLLWNWYPTSTGPNTIKDNGFDETDSINT